MIPAVPLMFLCSAALKIDSRGPVFYRQKRVTAGGVFDIIKLRTMTEGAENKTGAVLSGIGDERITWLGRFLRKSRLDEVPQLINVIAGDMSLIGPKPERPIFIEKYKKIIPDYDKRHSVKAGILGLTQIMGNYSTTTEDKLRYDLIYIRNYSFALDVKIFFLTLKTVFFESDSIQENTNIDYEEELKAYDIKIVE